MSNLNLIAEASVPEDAAPHLKRLQGLHKVSLYEQTDTSQFYPYFVRCSCGHEGRFYDLTKAKEHIYQHSGLTVQEVNTKCQPVTPIATMKPLK